MRPQPRRHRCTPHGLAHPDDPELQYQDAVIRNLEIISQALKDFGMADLIEIVPEMPWRQISGMRNRSSIEINEVEKCHFSPLF